MISSIELHSLASKRQRMFMGRKNEHLIAELTDVMFQAMTAPRPSARLVSK